ncbi:small multi-drug export protein [Salinicoccus sp. HZC-1]|uniref:small multi-drug export protein n=1 Tax=Salinicoccus sp. HZC-1 TaxID=3385497 RepID=UPI00398B1381
MTTSLLIAYIIVFLLSAVPLLEAFIVVPVAIFGGMNFTLTNIIGIAGNLLTLLILIVMMDRIKQWYLNKREQAGKGKSRKSQRAENIFQKYGLPGLAFIGPFFIGSHFTALMAVILGGPQKATFWWVTLSVAVWTIGISILFYFGIDFIGLEDKQFLNEFSQQ